MRKYDAIVVSTGPSRRIDRKRTLDAIAEVEYNYGSLKDYSGLWVAAGTLGGVEYSRSQRKGIYNLMIDNGIDDKNIKEIDGEDTAHKTKLLIDYSKEWGAENIAISTYWTHFLRYKMIIKQAKKEKYPGAEKVEIYQIRSSTTPFWRKPVDLLYGIFGLIKEKYRLIKYGFENSASGSRPAGNLIDKFKRMVGED